MKDDYLSRRRARLAQALPLGDAILLVAAGEPVPLPENSDQTYPFRSHAEYFYVAGAECAHGLAAFDPRDGSVDGWRSFVPRLTESERVWEGRGQSPGSALADFPRWLERRDGRRIAALGAPFSGELAIDAALTDRIREAFTHARRCKDDHELAVLRRAVAASAAGFARFAGLLRAGVTERELQIELEAEFFRHGGLRTGYGTIVGSGPNSAVLHFEPSGRKVQDGEFVLVDAGAEVERYTADVTRTYVAGSPDSFQRELYAVVLRAQERAIARCVVGAEWKQVHLAAAVDLVDGLVAMGVMRGDPDSLVEQEAHALFFPHGLGHMVGLGVRDASGLHPGRTKDPRPSLRSLRMDLPLEAGYVVTVEPGLYFIPALLNDAVRRTQYRDAVDWARVDQHLQIGGVRIEDNVLVTPTGPDVLTRGIPKAFSE